MLDLALLCFLPLLGGFLFVRGFLLTRYRTAREETARVYYRAAMAGAVLAAVGLLAHNELRRAVPAYGALALQTEAAIVTPLLTKPAAPTPAVATLSAAAAEVAAARVRAWIFWACSWGFLLGAATPVFNGLTGILLWLVHLLAIGGVALMRQFGWRPLGPLLSPIERLNRRAITDELERLLYEAMVRADSVQVSLDNQKTTRSSSKFSRPRQRRARPCCGAWAWWCRSRASSPPRVSISTRSRASRWPASSPSCVSSCKATASACCSRSQSLRQPAPDPTADPGMQRLASSMTMNLHRARPGFVIAALLLCQAANAGPKEALQSVAAGASQVATKVEKAVSKGVKAAASGVESGARAAGRAADKVAHKVGLPAAAAPASAPRRTGRH